LKDLVELIRLTMIGVFAAVFLMGADRVVDVPCGANLVDAVNGDSSTMGTRFQLEGGCTSPYTVDAALLVKDGDEIAGPAGTFVVRGRALDPQPTVTIQGSTGVANVIRAQGKVRVEWVKVVGGTGKYSAGSPLAGTGSGLAMGMASNDSSLYAVEITGSDGAGITNARGTFDSIELYDTTRDPNFLGFTGSGLKATNEVELRNSYVHDNQGNGIWCDEYCHDSAEHPNGFWIHDNLVVDNGRSGIRFEKVGDVADAGEALIEDNEVHSNSPGISVRDADNATIQNNRFGDVSIVGVAYQPNSGNLAITASDSGRTDRPDLFNVDILNNYLNGETIKGCDLPDQIVFCSANPPPDDATPPETTIDSGPSGTITSTTATFAFSSSETNSHFECKLEPVESAFSSCVSPKSYSGLANGSYTFSVRAIDAAGNTDTSPATRSFTVSTTQGGDTTPPTVVSTVPPTAGATGVAATTDVTATFSEEMMASSINGNTFNLTKKGSSTKITAKVSYDASTDTATLNPTNSLKAGVTYKAVVTTGAKDSVGNPLAQQYRWFFTVR
jgi:parallel beta-helix repeat protein